MKHLGGTLLTLLCAGLPLLHAASDGEDPFDSIQPPPSRFHLARQPVALPPVVNVTERGNAAPNGSFLPFGALENRGLAWLETTVFSAVTASHYWMTYTKWMEDWQYELSWEDQKRRLFTLEAHRLDTNCFMTNFVHTVHGAVLYNIARTNRLGTGESFLYALGGSLFWEFIVEWREIISLNDNILTPFGGFSLGEALFQTASHFNSRPGAASKVAGFLLNPVLFLNDWLNRSVYRKPPRPEPPGRGEIGLFFGLKNGSSSTTQGADTHFNLGFETEIITVPGHGEPGRIARTLTDTLRTRIFFQVALTTEGIEAYTARTEVVFLGRFWQTVHRDGNGESRGRSLTLGLGSALDFYKRRPGSPYDTCNTGAGSDARNVAPQPTEFSDKMNAAQIIGPVFSASLFKSPFSLDLTAAAYVHFSMINAWALNDYSREYDLSNAKTTILAYGYYYAYGLTFAGRLKLRFKNLRFEGDWRHYTFDSIEGIDRFQNLVTDDFHLHDTATFLRLGLGCRLGQTPFEIQAIWENISRSGRIEQFRRQGNEDRLILQLRLNW